MSQLTLAALVRLKPPARPPRAEDVLEQRAAFLIGAIANKLVNLGSAVYRREFGVGFTEWRVMVMLALEPGIPAKRICDVVGLDKAAISRGIATLHARGLIEPTPETTGKRSQTFVLTQAGRALHDKILAISRGHERVLLSALDPGEVPILLDMLRRVLAKVSDAGSAPADA